MGQSIIARNYAETLITLAERNGGDESVDEFGLAIDEVAQILEREPKIRQFLETPRIELDAKKQALRAAFSDNVPELFLRFILVVLEKRRQGSLRDIAEEYHTLVDERRGRARAEVTLARAADEQLQDQIVTSLEQRLGKKVTASFIVDPSLVGGIIIRVGGEILDGSLRRRAAGLRRRLLDARTPELIAE